ncbi:hypothetical protein IW145_000069 [Coemansia sp. RSA 521]|nr:hypothetical protein GGH17_000136 [Coemansia sp. RSA 788]KAJ2209282.1 hypothetical protein IW145_000069 [Coemansia sp. RSA 521]
MYKLVAKYKHWLIACMWILVTAYFIAGLVLNKQPQMSDRILFICLYVFATYCIVFSVVSVRPVTRRVTKVWQWVYGNVDRIPEKMRYPVSGGIVVAIFLSASLGFPTNGGESRLARMQSFFGILVITTLLYVTSQHRRHINWRTVCVGYLLQLGVGCLVMKTRWGSNVFSWLARLTSGFLACSQAGTRLLFGQHIMDSGAVAATMFPAIIFFASFVQIMYYVGAVQWVLDRVGLLFTKLMSTTRAEAVVAAASPFVGQSENVLLVKDLLNHMTRSELHACMTAGFATISGSVFQSYVALGVDAKSLITACVMSVPCSLALSKIRYPETEEPVRDTAVSRREKESNVLHAMANGAATGINLCLLILATVISMVSLIYAIDFALSWFGHFVGISDLTLELILGYVFYPLAWLLGVPGPDVLQVAQLLGLKLVGNEFIAYSKLTGAGGGVAVQDHLLPRSRMIAYFALAGFANTGSVAQVIAAFGALAPARKGDISSLALSACLTGAVATMLTAAIVSMIA